MGYYASSPHANKVNDYRYREGCLELCGIHFAGTQPRIWLTLPFVLVLISTLLGVLAEFRAIFINLVCERHMFC